MTVKHEGGYWGELDRHQGVTEQREEREPTKKESLEVPSGNSIMHMLIEIF